jgi:hypothetical protein
VGFRNNLCKDDSALFPVPEFTDPVYVKTSPKRGFSMTKNERFGLVFTKTGSINSGHRCLHSPCAYVSDKALRWEAVAAYYRERIKIYQVTKICRLIGLTNNALEYEQ